MFWAGTRSSHPTIGRSSDDRSRSRGGRRRRRCPREARPRRRRRQGHALVSCDGWRPECLLRHGHPAGAGARGFRRKVPGLAAEELPDELKRTRVKLELDHQGDPPPASTGAASSAIQKAESDGWVTRPPSPDGRGCARMSLDLGTRTRLVPDAPSWCRQVLAAPQLPTVGVLRMYQVRTRARPCRALAPGLRPEILRSR